MSGERTEAFPIGAAGEIETLAARWLERREREDWSEGIRVPNLKIGYRSRLCTWKRFLRIEDVWLRADRLRALGRSAEQDAPLVGSKFGLPILFHIAVSLVAFVAIVSATAVYLSAQRYQTAASEPLGA